jgi:hypothetical protein
MWKNTSIATPNFAYGDAPWAQSLVCSVLLSPPVSIKIKTRNQSSHFWQPIPVPTTTILINRKTKNQPAWNLTQRCLQVHKTDNRIKSWFQYRWGWPGASNTANLLSRDIHRFKKRWSHSLLANWWDIRPVQSREGNVFYWGITQLGEKLGRD